MGRWYSASFFDVDNTLISYSDSDVSIQTINLFNSLQSIGFETIVLVSNNSSVNRIQTVAKQLNLAAVTFACKPFVFTMRRILTDCNINDHTKAVFIGDQLFTDVLMANVMNIPSIFVDPINLDGVSFSKRFQYKLQSAMMSAFSRHSFSGY